MIKTLPAVPPTGSKTPPAVTAQIPFMVNTKKLEAGDRVVLHNPEKAKEEDLARRIEAVKEEKRRLSDSRKEVAEQKSKKAKRDLPRW